jgi:hypothetical protein
MVLPLLKGRIKTAVICVLWLWHGIYQNGLASTGLTSY